MQEWIELLEGTLFTSMYATEMWIRVKRLATAVQATTEFSKRDVAAEEQSGNEDVRGISKLKRIN